MKIRYLTAAVLAACCWQASSLTMAAENAPGVELSAHIELEAVTSDTDPNRGLFDQVDIDIPKVEIGAEMRLNDWITGSLLLLSEAVDNGRENSVDVATLTLANSEVTPFFFTVGKTVAPFGAFETNMVSDPLTLEMSESKEKVVMAGYEAHGIKVSGYAFNGENDANGDDTDYGVSLAYSTDNLNLGLDWISDFADSGGITGFYEGVPLAYSNRVEGISLHGKYTFGQWNVIGEYVGATTSFDDGDLAGDQPSAWNLELGYTLEQGIAGKETSVAVGYQQTSDAADLELPETRASLAMSVAVHKNATIGVELAHDQAYGDGEDGTTLTAQLALDY